MRLLNASTREVEEFYGTRIPQYAILSHVWGNEELSFHDVEVIARYRRSQQEHAAHIISRPADSSDAMRLMLLSSMLMAFRGDRSRVSRASLPAPTNGYGGEDDETNRGGLVPSTSPHPFELKEGYGKLAYACGQAERDGFQYLWVDTCCIDKRSSAEVSEAINSMFGWYQRAAVCYVYLDDVHFDDYTEGYLTWKDHFNSSRWFMRGWTLQELLAPRKVVLYAKGWRLLGTKSSLVKEIKKITKIDELTLLEPKLVHKASIAQRMSWAANRTTTRPENMAYSLMGIFGVNMPIIYGEGEHAFLRLQEEIIKGSDDHSIFAWGTVGQSSPLPDRYHPDFDDMDYDELTGTTGVLAKSPQDFAGTEHIVSAPPPAQNTSDYTMTNKGLHIRLPLFRTTTSQQHLAILNCHPEHDPSSRLAILLTETSTPNVFLRIRTRTPTPASAPEAATAKPKLLYIPNTPAQMPRAASLTEEVILLRAPDLLAPGYEVADIQGQNAVWNKEFRTVRVAGIRPATRRLYQLAVVTFWNRHVRCGFVVRVLVDGASKVCFVDLIQGLRPAEVGDDEGKWLVEQARWVWETPGTIEVSVPDSREEPLARRAVQVDVVNPVVGGKEEEHEMGELKEGDRGWLSNRGRQIKLSESVTFTEKWEKDYQRTVNAKVERKKNGAIELSMTSVLWEAAPRIQKEEELDQPH
ncbi:hypothetical protein VTI74DRAFT_8711 [Chaetomium olivicolor]